VQVAAVVVGLEQILPDLTYADGQVQVCVVVLTQFDPDMV
jgi:hypothetical protein